MTKALLTVKEVANRLKISSRKAYELVHVEGFPSVRISERVIRVPEDSLQEWLQSKKQSGY